MTEVDDNDHGSRRWLTVGVSAVFVGHAVVIYVMWLILGYNKQNYKGARISCNRRDVDARREETEVQAESVQC